MTNHKILRLGVRGDGIADGPVYVPMALPGEMVSGKETDSVLAEMRIIDPSPDRVSPPCPHYKSCGGCRMQHASDTLVADWKVQVIKEALSAHGLETSVRPIINSAPHTRRRASFAARRTKKGAIAGFHARASDTLVEIPSCKLLTPNLMKGLTLSKDLAQLAASRKSELNLAITDGPNGLDVSVSGGKPLDGPLLIALAGIADIHDLARLSWDDETVLTRRLPMQVFEGIGVTPSPGAFLQATKDGEEHLQSEVRSIVSDAKHVLDLFAGCGTFALPLSRNAAVHAIEGDAAMVDAMALSWRQAQGLKPLQAEVRDLFRNAVLSEDLLAYDAAVIDPPRAGAQAQVAELAVSKIPSIAYVSCNPASFARDAKCLFDGGYSLDWVQPIDQFRWSAHIELVAAFRFAIE